MGETREEAACARESDSEIERENERREERALRGDLFILISPTVISAKLKLPKEVSFASPVLPPTLFPPFFSYLSRTSLWFGVLLMPATSLPPANQPTKQPRAPLMLLLQISGRLLGCLAACGHYWSMRFSIFLARSRFSTSSSLPPSLFLSRSVSSPFLPRLFTTPRPPPFGRRLYPVSRASPSSFTPVFTFYFTSRSFIIFLISPGYPFVRDNCRKWGGSRAADGKWFFRPPSDLNLRAIVAARDPFSTAVSIRRSSRTPSRHSTRVHESVWNATEISLIGLLRDKRRLSDVNVRRSDCVGIPGTYYTQFQHCKMS